MIKIGGGDGPRRIHPLEPGGKIGDKGRDESRSVPRPAKKPETEEGSPRQRRKPDPGTGENVDIEA